MRRRRHRDKRKPLAACLSAAFLFLASVAAYSQVAPVPYPTAGAIAYAKSGVISTGPVYLNGCLFYSKNASAVYLQFFNSTTVPADGTAPVMASIAIQPSTNGAWDAGASGSRYFSTGLSWAASSTIDTKTLIASSDVLLSCTYNGNR